MSQGSVSGSKAFSTPASLRCRTIASAGPQCYTGGVSHLPRSRTNPGVMSRAARAVMFDRAFWRVFLAIAILAIEIWLAIFDHDCHRGVYGCN